MGFVAREDGVVITADPSKDVVTDYLLENCIIATVTFEAIESDGKHWRPVA
jgi:hypothetical protein